MNLSDWKGLSQDLPLHTPHVRVGSAGEGISLEIPAHLRPFEGKQVFSFVSPSTAAAHLLQSGTATLLSSLCFPSHYSIIVIYSN